MVGKKVMEAVAELEETYPIYLIARELYHTLVCLIMTRRGSAEHLTYLSGKAEAFQSLADTR